MFPGSILAMAAGAMFGVLWGWLLVWIGTVIGQTLAFINGRYVHTNIQLRFESGSLGAISLVKQIDACTQLCSKYTSI